MLVIFKRTQLLFDRSNVYVEGTRLANLVLTTHVRTYS